MSQTTQRTYQGVHSLDVYRVALEFYRRIVRLGLCGHAARQLHDAAESVVLNIGEAYPARGANRARKFGIAADEASECGAALDLFEARDAIAPNELEALRALLDRENAMLYRLARKR